MFCIKKQQRLKTIVQAGMIVIATLFMTGCGFTPQYAVTSGHPAVSDVLETVQIATIPDESGVQLKNALMDRFYPNGPAASFRYKLETNGISESRTDLDITIDEEATRRQIRVSTVITLRDLDTHDVILNRRVYALSSYNVLENQFTTRVAEQNARENAIADLARQIEQAVAIRTGR